MKEFAVAIADAEALDARLVAGLQGAVGHSVTVCTARSREEHRWQDRTSATRESIVGQVRDTGKGAKGQVNVGENAARLATGTVPHVIRPKLGRREEGPLAEGQTRQSRRHRGHPFLAFQAGGHTVFARSVNHPGTKPDPYLDRAAEAAGEELFAATEQMLDDLLGR